jgi:hypothetical protein
MRCSTVCYECFHEDVVSGLLRRSFTEESKPEAKRSDLRSFQAVQKQSIRKRTEGRWRWTDHLARLSACSPNHSLLGQQKQQQQHRLRLEQRSPCTSFYAQLNLPFDTLESSRGYDIEHNWSDRDASRRKRTETGREGEVEEGRSKMGSVSLLSLRIRMCETEVHTQGW